MKKGFFLSLLLLALISSFVFAKSFPPKSFLERVRERIQTEERVREEEFQRIRMEFERERAKSMADLYEEFEKIKQNSQQNFEREREKLRERLRQIRDERKIRIAERIYERINDLNRIITNHYFRVLDQMERVLARIESRTAKASLRGINIPKVEEAIKEAQSKIEIAREAVKVQAGKVYSVPQIANEEELKAKFGTIRQSFHEDIVKVRNIVFEAREAVKEAAVILAQVPRIDEIELEKNSQ